MTDTDISASAMERISTKLSTASSNLDGTAAPPEVPEAGEATGVLASMLSHMSLSMDGAITTLGAAGDAVTQSRDLFVDTEDTNKSNLHKD